MAWISRAIHHRLGALILQGIALTGCACERTEPSLPSPNLFAEQRAEIVGLAAKGQWPQVAEAILSLDTSNPALKHSLRKLEDRLTPARLRYYFVDGGLEPFVLCFIHSTLPSTLSPPCTVCIVVLTTDVDEFGNTSLTLRGATVESWRCFQSAVISHLDVMESTLPTRIHVGLGLVSETPDGNYEILDEGVAIVFEYDRENYCFREIGVLLDRQLRPKEELPPRYKLPDLVYYESCAGKVFDAEADASIRQDR